MKVHYSSFQQERHVCLAEETKTADIYKVDVLSPMQALQRIWNNFSTKVIANFWKYIGLLAATNGIDAVGSKHLETAETSKSLHHSSINWSLEQRVSASKIYWIP